ncbi:MAG: S8 family serine peptidase, partial [Lachnospiraceae bacterium]|nr:S8 family serine peptidase [Lachnospiraceae bacterium]
EEIGDLENGIKISYVTSDIYSNEELISAVEKDDSVISVHTDYDIELCNSTANEFIDYQWYKKAINYSDFSQTETQSGSDKDVIVAVIDTGIDYTQEELYKNMWVNDETEIEGIYGYDFVNNDSIPEDVNGHGTHVAGIIAGDSKDELGYSGIVGNGLVKIMSLKICEDEKKAKISEAIRAYQYISDAIDKGFNIVAVNNSWGTAEYSIELEAMIDVVGAKGALSVCAAGNSGNNNDEKAIYPACFDSRYVISVASTDNDNKLAGFSNYGVDSVDIAAPGVNIVSNFNEPVFNPSIYSAKEDYCQSFTDFSDSYLYDIMSGVPVEDIISQGVDPSDIINYYEINTSEKASTHVAVDDVLNFSCNKESGKSLHYSISNSAEGDILALTVPYSVIPSDVPTYTSIMTKAVSTPRNLPEQLESSSMYLILDGAGTTNVTDALNYVFKGVGDNINILNAGYFNQIYDDEWSQACRMIADKSEELSMRNLYIIVYSLGEEQLDLYLDDWGTSASGLVVDDFNKYNFMSGTSMSAPMVTSAVAMTALAFPQEGCLDHKTRILESVTKVDSLEGKVATGGVLNISEIPNVTVKSKPDITINGFQINPYVEGIRTIYTISSFDNVEKLGLIYGLAGKVSDDEMILDSPNPKAVAYQATERGLMATCLSDKEGAKSLAMTMKYDDANTSFLSQDLLIRSYAVMDDGSIVYSDICTTSIYKVADNLYQNVLMNSAETHNYLYDRILFAVDEEYKPVEFVPVKK